MAIQVRRGNEADFDASKMLPGEWAVSLDTRYVRMCFAPGLVLRMSTYESFEADMAQIQEILLECRTIQSAVQRIQAEVNAKASLTIEYSNSAKKYADNAYAEAERAKTYADNAEAVTGVQIATKDKAGLIKGGDNHIAEDGTLMLITPTDQTTMPNSYDGRFLFKKIKGVCQQGANPSLTSSQEIKNSVINWIKTHGENLLDLSNARGGVNNGITVTMNTDGSYLYVGTASNVDINVWLLGDYATQKEVFTMPAGVYYVKGVNLYSNTKVLLWGREGSFVTLKEDTVVTGVRAVNAVSGTTYNETHYPIIVKTDVIPTTWKPYTKSLFTFSQPIKLYGNGNVQDTVEGGKVKRRFGVVVLNGTESYRYYNKAVACNVIDSLVKPSDSNYVIPNILSERFIADTPSNVLNGVNENTITVAISADTFRLRLHSDLLTSAEDAVSYFSANPTEIIYELAEEVTEELPLADQIALNSLVTFYGITYLEFDSEVQPTFEGEYGTSKVGGMTLESLLTARNNDLRLSSLEASVVNNI